MHLSGPIVDTIADYLAIVVLFVVPVVLIYLFWMIHIMPEKIAERRGHPQADAIKTLCLLSLVFGGLLWPVAWLWAYSKPVLHKMAYGTDRIEHGAAPVLPGSAGAHPAAPETPLVNRPAAERRD
jgi:CBS domain containing-hemolysin-like protein